MLGFVDCDGIWNSSVFMFLLKNGVKGRAYLIHIGWKSMIGLVVLFMFLASLLICSFSCLYSIVIFRMGFNLHGQIWGMQEKTSWNVFRQ